MAIPAYLWLQDEQGNDIRGSVNVTGREGSIELIEFDHSIYIPTDNDTGELTGTRKHGAIRLVKAFDESSPYLFKACCNGQKLKNAVIRWYKIDDSGQEVEYYQHELEGVKINSYSPGMANTKDVALERIPHIENISLRYEKITHTYLDGNISHFDSWNEGR
ncbi:MAG: Hcp family type VI secretion system effector [Saccharospirillum sp.]|uniref:Hcp family type VI secretion system effector n=1 Tax=Saccharospirillum sp. TaxID=2033801 RepID=UPI00329865F4